MTSLGPTCVWRLSADVVRALDQRLGPPLDRYVNGTQTWLTPAPSPSPAPRADDCEATIEWRLHPAAAFRAPAGLSHYDLWDTVVDALGAGADPDELPMGEERRALASLWDGLEAFPAYGDEMEPAVLAGEAGARLGRAPDAAGLVDHDRVGREWERRAGGVSLVGLVLDELTSGASGGPAA